MKDQQFCISVFAVDLTFQVAIGSTSPDLTTVSHAWLYGRFIDPEQPQEKNLIE